MSRSGQQIGGVTEKPEEESEKEMANNSNNMKNLSKPGKSKIQMSGKMMLSFVLLSFVSLQLAGQNQQHWVATFNGTATGNDGANSVTADGSGNIIAAGYTEGLGTGADCLIVKYNSDGEKLWERTLNGSNGDVDFFNDVTTDASGNIYATGNVSETTGLWNLITIKYDPDGNQVWAKQYDGTANSYDGGMVIEIDGDGNCIVGGYSENTGNAQDFILLKYDLEGNELWHRSFNGNGSGNDVILSVTTDDTSNVYITGRSVGTEQSDDYATIKYDALGVQKWVAIYNDPAVSWGETPRSVAVDHAGNVYVSGWGADGYGLGDLLTIKYNANGVQQWLNRYHGPSIGGEGAYSVRVDENDNVYVAGSVNGPFYGQQESDSDFVLIKFAPDSTIQWVKTYNGPATAENSDWILAMELAPNGNIFVSGWSEGIDTGLDFVTIAYDRDGNQQWLERYDAGFGSTDEPFAMAIDPDGDICVSGFGIIDSTYTSDMLTIKYFALPTGIHTNPGASETLPSVKSFPNPFKNGTTIRFTIQQASFVNIQLFNLTGRKIKSLVNEFLEAGQHEVFIDATDMNPGTYICKVRSGSVVAETILLRLE